MEKQWRNKGAKGHRASISKLVLRSPIRLFPLVGPHPPQTNTTLEVLELNGNVIDYEGIGAIAEALTQNTSLKTLGLRCALLSLPSAPVCLKEGIAEHTSLKALGLSRARS